MPRSQRDTESEVNLLDLASECRLGAFLSGRGDKTHVIAPPRFLEALRALNPTSAWTGASEVMGIPASSRWIFVHDPTDEAGLLARVSAVAPPGSRVRGLLQHLIPLLVTRQGFSATPWEQLPAPEVRYALVCLPRTGSTYLCELLEAAGLGAPREHLRPPLLHVLRSRQISEEAVYQTILRHGAAKGVFGTKLISEFLDKLPGPPASRLMCLAERGFRFIHLQRDLSSQAVSKYLAGQSGVWHQRGHNSTGAIQRLEAVPYDFGLLCQRYQQAWAAQRWLLEAVTRLPVGTVLNVDYDQLVKDPQAILEACADFLGVPRPMARPAVNRALPQQLASSLPHGQALRQRFLAELRSSGWQPAQA